MDLRGRPSIYTQELVDRICERLAAGESLRSICRDDDMPAESTVRQWAIDDINGFYAHYARARDMGLDSLVEETIEIADHAADDFVPGAKGEKVLDREHVKRSELRVAARQWYAERMAPKKYGAKQQIDLHDTRDLDKKIEEGRKRVGKN